MGIPVDAYTMDETLQAISDVIENKEHIHHGVINAGKVVAMHRDPQLWESVVSADMINADGAGVVWASKKLNDPLPERVAGVDLMQELIPMAAEKGYKVFFFGAKEEVVKKVVDIYTDKFGQDIVAGYRNGYYTKEEEAGIAESIGKSGANMLFVAISSPKKELFLYEHRALLKSVNFIMGVGGSFDVVAGKVKRAPMWLQKLGLEGLARFIQEPGKMWKRFILDNTRFVILVYKYKLGILGKKDQGK